MAKMVQLGFTKAMECYDMKSAFPGYFSNSTENLSQLWASGLIILDTNVLLNLYRYSDSTKTELLGIIKKLSDRIWIPNQVAKEFLSNRLTVIGEQSELYKSHLASLQEFKRPLESQKKHPFISEKLFNECDNIFEKLRLELEAGKNIHDDRINSDDIKDDLSAILEGKVGNGYNKETLEKIIMDGELRYGEKIPPGFKDIKKGGDSKLLNDRLLKYGDYIIWLQILEHSKNDKRSVIFVTGDVKEDWWLTFNGKTIAPHPLLVEEFSETVGLPFHMYPVDIFLERAGLHLKKKTSEDSLKEVREVQKHEGNAILDIAFGHAWPNEIDHAILQEVLDSDSMMASRADFYENYMAYAGNDDLETSKFNWKDPTGKITLQKEKSHKEKTLRKTIINLTAEKDELDAIHSSLINMSGGHRHLLPGGDSTPRIEKIRILEKRVGEITKRIMRLRQELQDFRDGINESEL
ncbi:Uncharacterized protein ALO87_01618 [Pseudomonas syringae pv. apii]|nr:Uncharacterized protein ALO87_01618 [Pseudomonas syringae pv. apii]